jgi:hypothetical protein
MRMGPRGLGIAAGVGVGGGSGSGSACGIATGLKAAGNALYRRGQSDV